MKTEFFGNLRPWRILRDTCLVVSLSIVVLLAPIAVGLARSPGNTASIQENQDLVAQAEVEQRSEVIERELKSLKGRHAWAGEYYEGDGLGANIRLAIAPDNGVAATWHGCLGLYGANIGHVSPEPDGSLRFRFERPNKDRFGGFPSHVQRVKWGQRRYLIPATELDRFVTAVNHGHEPRPQLQGMFLLADGDERKPVIGLPELPAVYRDRIRMRALTANVLRVEPLGQRKIYGDMCDKRYRLHLTVADQGLLSIGEELRPVSPEDAFGKVVIENASPGLAVGTAEFMETTCPKPEHVPDTDWAFTTGAYDPVASNRSIRESAR